MLTHHFSVPVDPGRVVVVGAGGFVGKATVGKLTTQKLNVVGITRQDVDLLSEGAVARLVSSLRTEDTLVVIAARAPVKSDSMLIENLRMMETVCAALHSVPVGHVIYISSDAVYADAAGPLNETSCAQPVSLHGVMHLAREVMLANAWNGPLCVLRPTLIYGAADPHNGYGPNRFRRLANRGEEILLFGDGEERRDHVYIDDVAEIIARCIVHKSVGTLNIATGNVVTFREIAERIARLVPTPTSIRSIPRTGLMPHGGYRAFDVSSTTRAFPDFGYTPLELGLVLSQNREYHNG